MRILSVTAQKVDSTGSGVFLTELVKGLRKLGCAQAVVCGTVPEDTIRLPEEVALFPVYYNCENLPFPICGMSDEMPYESTRYRDLTEEMTYQLFSAFRARITEAVENFRPDVILCHHLYFLAALVRQLYPDIPVYGQCHGSDLRQIRKNPWQREWIMSQIRNLNGIFALHQQQKETICETFCVPESLVTVMGTGYNSDVFFLNEAVRESRDPRKLRLIFAGKLSEKKGLFSLLRALRQLSYPQQVELVLAGGYGNATEYAEICRLAQVSPCPVTFLGRLSQQELALEMNKSDAFILPSFFEGVPLVLIEAMACGLKTICTDLPGIRHWLDQAIPVSGTIFVKPPRMRNEDEPYPEDLPGFETQLAEAIDTVRNRPSANLALVQQVSWDALCKKYCAIWNEPILRRYPHARGYAPARM